MGAMLTAAAACNDGSTGPEQEIDDYPYPVGRIVLSKLPVDIDRVHSFVGIGNLNILPEDHGGFYTPRGGHGLEPTIPVYAPADGKVLHVSRRVYPELMPYGDDFDLDLRLSRTIVVTYAHMSGLADELLDAAGPSIDGFEGAGIGVEVEAGQILGYAGTQTALDWHLKDSEIEPSLLGGEGRYPDGWGTAGCYHEYYDEPLRAQLLSITVRTVEPRCGKIDFDVAGRIVGNWFWEAEVPTLAFGDYSTHLAIAYDWIRGDRIAIADGEGFREGVGVRYWVKDNGPKPETIGVADGLVKYELLQAPPGNPYGELLPPDPTIVGVFLVQLLEPGRLKVERVLGKTAAQVDDFSGAARIYVR